MKANLTILADIPQLRKDLYTLFCGLKKGIGPYDLIETGDGDIPGIDVTIGCTFDFDDASISWSYQTGDNSYTGGAYGHPEWFTCSVMKRTNCKELANEIIDEIHGRIQELVSLQKQEAKEAVA
jgi:hypothetical protein